MRTGSRERHVHPCTDLSWTGIVSMWIYENCARWIQDPHIKKCLNSEHAKCCHAMSAFIHFFVNIKVAASFLQLADFQTWPSMRHEDSMYSIIKWCPVHEWCESRSVKVWQWDQLESGLIELTLFRRLSMAASKASVFNEKHVNIQAEAKRLCIRQPVPDVASVAMKQDNSRSCRDNARRLTDKLCMQLCPVVRPQV